MECNSSCGSGTCSHNLFFITETADDNFRRSGWNYEFPTSVHVCNGSVGGAFDNHSGTDNRFAGAVDNDTGCLI